MPHYVAFPVNRLSKKEIWLVNYFRSLRSFAVIVRFQVTPFHGLIFQMHNIHSAV